MPATAPRKEQVNDQALIIDTCHTLHHDLYPSWSRDQLLCNPHEAAELCSQVRRKLHRPSLTDYQILWPYLNAHKRGLFNAKQPPRASRRPSRRKS